jgi:GxxExxY protein
MLHSDLTGVIIDAFYTVYNTLGYGFLEKVYENALAIELRQRGLVVAPQVPIHVYYEGQLVGDYFADLLVNGIVILEIKAAEDIIEAHSAQLINYLKATDIEVGLVLNFGPKPTFKRKVFSNTRKPSLRR